jgi:hypothetical protein
MQRIGWRSASTVLGMAAAGLGMFGAYEFGYKLEGGVSYLTIAAPVIAMAAALIPPFAETSWRSGQYAKSLLWWAILIPAALTVFFGNAERVHVAKAGAQAERDALRGVADRTRQELAEAKLEAAKAQAKALKAEAKKACNLACREDLKARDEAASRVEAAKAALFEAEAKATSEASLKAPEWLLPASLDFIAFMGIWSGMTGPRAAPKRSKVAPKRKAWTCPVSVESFGVGITLSERRAKCHPPSRSSSFVRPLQRPFLRPGPCTGSAAAHSPCQARAICAPGRACA